MKSKHQLKPVGTWEVLRRVGVSITNHSDNSLAVDDVVSQVTGVKNIVLDNDARELWVLYDASQVDYQAIVQALTEAGFPPIDNWWTRFKGSIYQYSDTNARVNAKAPPPACCNKSPK
ncbi:heavy-metal-associated domain-containing protein [Sedimenticola selenatireducens]|uniref:heavy-metal-associated domain-containing protein n=1 Tax=Sedimenticola selenatireducens TaxID=191960 RepID=UPI0023532F89|nr:heavy-metal-associated domain-containing protein [Sedimenticola selenatireducens]